MYYHFYFRFLASLITIFLFPYYILAQNSLNQELDILFQNWEYFQDKEDFDRAIDQAKKAFQLSRKNNQEESMALALNRQGKSLIKKTNRVNKNQKLAEEIFLNSLYHLTNSKNSKLQIDNLEQLIWLAIEQEDTQKVAAYSEQIEQIKKLKQTTAENDTLSKNKEFLEVERDQLAIQKNTLSEKIQSLTQTQLESELLIALQKNQVDSFRFENIKDALLLEKNNSILTEQASKLELQQSQIELHTSQRNLILALIAIIGLVAIGAIVRYLETKKHYKILHSKNEIIEGERKKSEQLLLNILPAVVANELKMNGVAVAKRYEHATVFFSDFKNFSQIAKSLSPEKLVHQLDFHFKAFDEIIEKYSIEKIKTIGDAYMCVSGLPEKNPNNAVEIINAALEIQAYLEELKKEKSEKGEPYFEARIGIHTGPLVAGVVGSKKFAYDVWGDTVNIAARLESKGEVGKVNISHSTYKLVKGKYNCISRGKIPIKNRGEIEMYFIEEK
ncbi:MAG: class 3 adenylate cyclase [Granulosicoccus sp.]|jgi:class 3 adenylate cyclase